MEQVAYPEFSGFDWDKGNLDKNWTKHQISKSEAEEVFFNTPLILLPDIKHSNADEARFLALGTTNEGKRLLIVYTIRKGLIRPISFRKMHPKERAIYEEGTQGNPEV